MLATVASACSCLGRWACKGCVCELIARCDLRCYSCYSDPTLWFETVSATVYAKLLDTVQHKKEKQETYRMLDKSWLAIVPTATAADTACTLCLVACVSCDTASCTWPHSASCQHDEIRCYMIHSCHEVRYDTIQHETIHYHTVLRSDTAKHHAAPNQSLFTLLRRLV